MWKLNSFAVNVWFYIVISRVFFYLHFLDYLLRNVVKGL